MVTKHREIAVTIILLIVTALTIFFIVRNNSEVEDFMGLTREQHQLLVNSILPVSLESMNEVEVKNAFTILDAMREIGFVENRSPGESGVSLTTWILEMLELGEIRDFAIVENNSEGPGSVRGHFIARFSCENDEEYYMFYNKTWGLQWVRRGDRRGEAVFDSHLHFIDDGRIVERENPHGGMEVD